MTGRRVVGQGLLESPNLKIADNNATPLPRRPTLLLSGPGFAAAPEKTEVDQSTKAQSKRADPAVSNRPCLLGAPPVMLRTPNNDQSMKSRYETNRF